MKWTRFVVALAWATLASGCAKEAELSGVAVSSADLELVALGEDAFGRCSGCHSIGEGEPSRAGSNLFDVIGRRAGSLPGFDYTDALAESAIVWTTETLDAYLADPEGTVPGTEMQAGTVRDAEQRKAIIAYLGTLTAD